MPMRKSFIAFLFCLAINSAYSQTPTLQQKLYYTCKVWGFVKYYHSEVSTCHVNWDSVLLHVLPLVESAVTSSDFNDAIDTMLVAAGPMALSTSYFPDTIHTELKRNRDWSWISTPILRTDVQTILDTIKNNFRPHTGCWVEIDTFIAHQTVSALPWGGYLEFPYDTTLLNVNTTISYPDKGHRLLMMFKFWNIVRYFNPYNYVLDISWDTTLSHYVIPIDTVSNAYSLYLLQMNMATALNDAHVYGLTYSNTYQMIPGFYKPFIRMQYLGGQYVVLKSLVTGVYPGDAIISVDGLTTTQWEDSLKQYYSSGNISVFRRSMCDNILGRQANGTNETIVVEDSTGANHTINTPSVWWASNPGFFNNWYYPADSLSSISWATLSCGIGYVNIGNITDAGADSAYTALYTAPAIIIDIRNYPISNSGFDIARSIFSSSRAFATLTFPDVTYPGTYFYATQYEGYSGNPTPYKGKVIILMNEQTQSAAEYDCMVLSAASNVVKVGSQTAGADGNITWLHLSDDMQFGYTSLGVFYPNGDSTQRIGIVPDSVVYPTKAGIRNGDDEVLDKALQIGGCNLTPPSKAGINNTAMAKTSVSVFPNPANETVTITANNIGADKVTIHIMDIAGRILLQNEVNTNNQNLVTSFDIKTLSAGMYFVTVKADGQQYVNKIVKE
jgi:carboxyl-terminal processing protease